MFVVIKEIIAALAPGAVIYPTILTRLGRIRLTERTSEKLRGEFFIFGRECRCWFSIWRGWFEFLF